jgi:hypothetical protein
MSFVNIAAQVRTLSIIQAVKSQLLCQRRLQIPLYQSPSHRRGWRTSACRTKSRQYLVNAMLASHTSATNCARLYHRSFSWNNISPSDWPVGFALIAERIWDAFTITCLLDDNARLGSQIIAPNTGPQKDRFTGAIEARSLRFRLYGQPELSHRWDKCLRIFHGEEAWVVVVDAA